MKVSCNYKRTSAPHVFEVIRSGIVPIGMVVSDLFSDKWLFKHYMLEDLLFVGDNRDAAVSAYYKYFGGND